MHAPARSRKIRAAGRPTAAAGALAGPVAGVEMRPAGVRVGRADADIPSSRRRSIAIAPAGVRIPDRGGAPALRIGRLVDDAALERPARAGFPSCSRRRPRARPNPEQATARRPGLSWRQANHALAAASRRAVDAVGGQVPPACAAVLVLARHEHSPPRLRRARARAGLEDRRQPADRPAVSARRATPASRRRPSASRSTSPTTPR